MAIGLGGIAKGYGLDRAAAILRGYGLADFHIDGGGDVLVSGHVSGRPWRVGIRHPRDRDLPNRLLTVLSLEGGRGHLGRL